jgi:hypothetical protein
MIKPETSMVNLYMILTVNVKLFIGHCFVIHRRIRTLEENNANVRKTGGDMSTSRIPDFICMNSRFQLHEFTISTEVQSEIVNSVC